MADYKDSEKQAYDDNAIHPTTSVAQGTHRRASINDAVFGDISEDGPNYRAVCCLHCCGEPLTNVRRSAGKAHPY